MATSTESEKRIIKLINDTIGSDFKKLSNVQEIIDGYKDRLDQLHDKLHLAEQKKNPQDNMEPLNKDAKFNIILQKQQFKCNALEFEMVKLQQMEDKIKIHINELEAMVESVQPDLKRLHQLHMMVHYLQILKDAQETSESLQLALEETDDNKLVNLYLHLYEDELDKEHSILGVLQNLKGANVLRAYVTSLASHWFEILSDRFTQQFENTLKELKWGQNDDFNEDAFDTNLLNRAELLAEYLFLLKLPEENADKYINIGAIVCRSVSAVTKYLILPYKRRFQYHFVSKRPTNRLEKPEWYFIQILKWCKSVHTFVEKTFQSAVVKAGKLDFNIGLDFIQGLVQLAIHKLMEDIKEICMDENIFAHLIDEILLFERELQENLGYPPSCPSVINVITQAAYFTKWMTLERKFCDKRMNEILVASDAWKFIYPDPTEDEMKMPKCADHFVRLLDAIKKRYCILTEPGHQLQFLALQNELIEKFITHLMEMERDNKVNVVKILNAINYLTSVLSEWSENFHYLHLQTLSTTTNEAGDVCVVFEKPLNILKEWNKTLLEKLSENIYKEIVTKLISYRDERWSSLSDKVPEYVLSVSPSFGGVLQKICLNLFTLKDELALNLFNDMLRIIARKIDDYLLRNVIMSVTFSTGGILQFSFDIKNYLFVAFNQHMLRPELLFVKVHDVTKLLTLDQDVALLLLSKLKGDLNTKEEISTLQKLGISNLGPMISTKVLERRNDLSLLALSS